jgi:Short C-terminal domain
MGLLKTGLKAAVAVKTADVIHERVLARQQAHAVAQGHAAPAQPGQGAPMAPASAQPSSDMGEKLAQLQQLGELRASGVLTDAEFEAQKAAILGA